MKKFSCILVFAVLLGVFQFSGCAKTYNSMASDGGIIGSYPGDYIVRNDSGGKIMDVWVLENVMVQSEERSDGWLFQDLEGNVIHLGGDVKVKRCKTRSELNRYHEYHAEFTKKSYQELYAE